MKLINCYVSSFGKLKDFSYDFSDGLNTVKQDNGWGKSTLAAFIKAMFYGLNDSKRTLEDNERKKFAPWNSTEKFGGNLVCERNGERFKIERFFGSKESEDAVKVYYLATNKVFTEGKEIEDLGKRIFSIDEEGFLSTTFFSQKDFEIKSNTSITAKYNEICEIQDSDAFDKAVEKLDERIKELKQRGDKGKIADLKRDISLLDDSIERTKLSLKTVEEMKKDLETVNMESDNLDKSIKKLTEKLEKASKKEAENERKKRLSVINAELADVFDKKTAAESVFNGKRVSESRLLDCEKCIADLREESAKEKTLKADISDFVPSVNTKVKPSGFFKILAVISVAFALLGIILAAVGRIWALSFLGAGVIGGVIAIAKLWSVRLKNLNEKQNNNKLAEIYERKMRDIKECEQAIAEIKQGLDAFFSGFVISDELAYEQKVAVLKENLKTLNECYKVSDKLNVELSELKAAGFSAGADDVESVAELNEKLQVATKWYKEKVSKAEQIKTRIDALESQADSIVDSENKKAELKERLSDSEKLLDILTLTKNFMLKADETLKTKYRAPLSESLNKYVKMIAGDKVAVSIDTDLKVTVSVGGAEREADFFSKGYRNLFEICKRFALTDILFTAEKPFIILDDPFYNLDDEKLNESLSLIKKLAKEYQIIYLVCHESRRA